MKKTFFLFSILLSLALLSSAAVFAETHPLEFPDISASVDSLIKGSTDSVYYYASDGKRYVFPTANTYKSWYVDFSNITTVPDSELANYPLGGNVTYRPGYKMVKITTDPKVYVVDKGGVLRWVTSEEIALALYGDNWSNKIDDVPDSFFTNYVVGEPIDSLTDFSIWAIFWSTITINDDKSITIGKNPQESTTSYIGEQVLGSP